jgi:hypothetical protein
MIYTLPGYSCQEPKRLRNLVNTQNLKTSSPKPQQAIQKQLLRPTKINPAKAVISFTQSDRIEVEKKYQDRPGYQPGLSHLNLGSCP